MTSAGFGSRRATLRFIDWIREYAPDVIHLHNLHGYYINIGVLFNYLQETDKPVVWTLHDCWAFTGHCTHFDYVGCSKWKTGCFECPEKHSYPASIMLDNSRSNYENKKHLFTSLKDLTIVTPSNWLADLVKLSYLSKYSVQVIHNGIDLSQFRPRTSDFRNKYGIADKTVLLGVASTWNRRKGLDTFFSLAQMVDAKYVIVLVGLSQVQLRRLPRNIIGIQRTDNIKELAEIYTAANVFVNPTVEEVFGMVNIEALACGTPVITFDTGGSPESLTTLSGIITKDKTPRSILDMLETACQIKGSNCINRSKSFMKSKMTLDYLRLYNKSSRGRQEA